MTLNPGTPIETIENVIDLVDLILIMSVNPGFGGQAFIPGALEKVSRARALAGGAADRHRDRRRRHAGQRRGGRARRRQRAGRGLGRLQGRACRLRQEHRGDPQCRRDGARGSRVNAAHTRSTISAIAPPEPEPHTRRMIARATAMRAMLRGAQAECEANGRVSDEVNDELIRAGFYRVVQPRCFGGYEFDVPTFYRVMMEIARGCPETGWVLALTAGHPLIIANFPLEGQRDVYGKDGEFRCPAAFNPHGAATPVAGGYRLTASWPSASGCDIGTHHLGSATVIGADGKPTRTGHPGAAHARPIPHRRRLACHGHAGHRIEAHRRGGCFRAGAAHRRGGRRRARQRAGETHRPARKPALSRPHRLVPDRRSRVGRGRRRARRARSLRRRAARASAPTTRPITSATRSRNSSRITAARLG